MFAALAKKELRVAIRTRKVWLVAGACLLLSSVAGAMGTLEQRESRALFEEVSALGKSAFDTQRPDHPHAIAHNGYVVARPPAPLGYLDAGLDRAYGRWLRLDAHQTRSLEGARISDLSRGPGGGRFDLGLFLSVLAPALVLLLCFDQVSEERARGTFAMLRAAGAEPVPLAAAKMLGAAVRTTIGIFLPAALVALAAALVMHEAEPARLALWLAVHLLALLGWSLLALHVSTSASDSRNALLLGLALWAGLALVVPPTASALATLLAPPPPPGELLVKAAALAESAHAQSEELVARARRDIQRRHPEWDGHGEPPEVIDAVMLRLADADAAERSRALFDDRAAAEDREARLVAALDFASPSGLASLLSADLAGSDLLHLRSVFDHYESYRRALMSWFNTWWAEKGRSGFQGWEGERKFDDMASAPRPERPSFPLSLAIERARLPFLLLLGLSLFLSLSFVLRMRLLLGARP